MNSSHPSVIVEVRGPGHHDRAEAAALLIEAVAPAGDVLVETTLRPRLAADVEALLAAGAAGVVLDGPASRGVFLRTTASRRTRRGRAVSLFGSFLAEMGHRILGSPRLTARLLRTTASRRTRRGRAVSLLGSFLAEMGHRILGSPRLTARLLRTSASTDVAASSADIVVRLVADAAALHAVVVTDVEPGSTAELVNRAIRELGLSRPPS